MRSHDIRKLWHHLAIERVKNAVGVNKNQVVVGRGV